MNRILFTSLLILLAIKAFAQDPIPVTIIRSEAVTGITEINYTLPPSGFYNISVSVSFDNGTSYTPIAAGELSGYLEAVPSGPNTLTWTPGSAYMGLFHEQTRIKIDALPSTFTDTRDNYTYRTVRIGSQVWMAENLKYLPSVVGPNIASNTEPYYYVYDYEGTDVTAAKATGNYQNYGVLYNWPAALGACPAGWNLPGDAQWTELINYVVSQEYPNSNVVNGAGNALKSCRQIDSPQGGECNTSAHPRWNSDNTHHGLDAFGFSALPGGRLHYQSESVINFREMGNYGQWWSSTQNQATTAWYRDMGKSYGSVSRSSYTKA